MVFGYHSARVASHETDTHEHACPEKRVVAAHQDRALAKRAVLDDMVPNHLRARE